jgi:hypothetical protein
MTSKSWPIARTLRSALAAAINEAIGGTNADPVPQGPARPEPATNRQHQDTGSPYFDGEPDSLGSMDWSRRTFPAVRRITIRWKLRSDPFESAKSHFFDTSSWGEFCDVTLTLKQAWQPNRGGWVKIDDYRCSAFRRHGKRLRVLPVLEKGEVRARALRPWECGASGRWHIH